VKIITDMGGPVTATETLYDDANEVVSEKTINIGRYGVWDGGNVIATGDDLDALQQEHGPDLRVVPYQGLNPRCWRVVK